MPDANSLCTYPECRRGRRTHRSASGHQKLFATERAASAGRESSELVAPVGWYCCISGRPEWGRCRKRESLALPDRISPEDAHGYRRGTTRTQSIASQHRSAPSLAISRARSIAQQALCSVPVCRSVEPRGQAHFGFVAQLLSRLLDREGPVLREERHASAKDRWLDSERLAYELTNNTSRKKGPCG